MPETAPVSRSILIQVRELTNRHLGGTLVVFILGRFFLQSLGVEVERVPTSRLMDVVNRCVQEDNMTFLHSYDDLDLIAGHARYQ